MPELPEVETVRRVLQSKILHRTVTDLEIITPKSFLGDPKLVIGQDIISFSRIGKQLSIHLSNGLILLFHLKMTGQLIFIPLSSKGKTPTKVGEGDFVLGHPTKDAFLSLPNKSTRVIFHFGPPSSRGMVRKLSDQGVLYFNDQRKFGWIKLLNQAELVEAQRDLGLDVLNPDFTLDYFHSRLNSHRAVKLVLLDQARFAGIGNIYANDALFLAKIHPSIPADSLTSSQVKKLHQAVIGIITESLSHGGSTARDNKYVLPDGSFGSHQYHFRVYQRTGEPCLICGTPIKNLKIGGRGTFYCPKCQIRST